MNRTISLGVIPDSRGQPSLGSEPLRRLLERVAERGDRKALDEIIQNRRLFRHGNKTHLSLPAFVFELIERWKLSFPGQTEELRGTAYDLALDRFFNLPDHGAEGGRDPKGPSGQSRTDCRFYYRAFLGDLRRRSVPKSSHAVLEEYEVASLFARFVARHCYLSLLEAKRRILARYRSRYTWQLHKDRSVRVWFPRSVASKKRKRWLEANVPDPDPTRPGEQQRVQAIIDALLPATGQVSFDDLDDLMAVSYPPTDWTAIERDSLGFPECIAGEKAQSIHLQRRSVRELGKRNVERLVLAVFKNVVTREKTDRELATEFGLSQRAFSDFAGSD